MRALMMGGPRFIGPYVVRAQAAAGHNLTIFHRGQTVAELPPGVQSINGERSNLPTFADIFKPLARVNARGGGD